MQCSEVLATVAGADVNEVNVEPVDRCYELWKRVQFGFNLPPVVMGAPLADECLDSRELHALVSVIHCLLVGPPRRRDSVVELDERRFRNVDPEGRNAASALAGAASETHR